MEAIVKALTDLVVTAITTLGPLLIAAGVAWFTVARSRGLKAAAEAALDRHGDDDEQAVQHMRAAGPLVTKAGARRAVRKARVRREKAAEAVEAAQVAALSEPPDDTDDPTPTLPNAS